MDVGDDTSTQNRLVKNTLAWTVENDVDTPSAAGQAERYESRGSQTTADWVLVFAEIHVSMCDEIY